MEKKMGEDDTKKFPSVNQFIFIKNKKMVVGPDLAHGPKLSITAVNGLHSKRDR